MSKQPQNVWLFPFKNDLDLFIYSMTAVFFVTFRPFMMNLNIDTDQDDRISDRAIPAEEREGR
jgi:hypothetical protein